MAKLGRPPFVDNWLWVYSRFEKKRAYHLALIHKGRTKQALRAKRMKRIANDRFALNTLRTRDIRLVYLFDILYPGRRFPK